MAWLEGSGHPFASYTTPILASAALLLLILWPELIGLLEGGLSLIGSVDAICVPGGAPPYMRAILGRFPSFLRVSLPCFGYPYIY